MKNKDRISEQQEEVDKNYEFFKKELPSLLKEHKGEFILIRDQRIEAYCRTFEEAVFIGKEKFSDNRFSIQEVTNEPIDLYYTDAPTVCCH